jgi:hypothetical protein
MKQGENRKNKSKTTAGKIKKNYIKEDEDINKKRRTKTKRQVTENFLKVGMTIRELDSCIRIKD